MYRRMETEYTYCDGIEASLGSKQTIKLERVVFDI